MAILTANQAVLDDVCVDLDAKHYAQNAVLQRTLADQLIEDVSFCPKSFVLDVGCGDGYVTSKVASLVPDGHVVGLDSSQSMISHAQEEYSGPGYRNLSFIKKDAQDFACPERFDYIVSFSAFHWVRDAKGTLERLCASLRPGGELIILTYPSESKYYEFMQSALQKKFPEYSHKSAYNTMLDCEGYKNTLLNCGMNLQSFEAKNLSTKDANVNETRNFIEGWLTSFVPLPKEYHEDYLDHVIQESSSFTRTDNMKNIYLPYTELVIRAKKV